MDFIGPLPKSQGYDSIAVVVDKLTKLVHFIATKTTVTAREFALLFFNNIVRLHGVPDVIISDRDTRFTSSFWKELMKLMNVEQRMSSAFHPESDGQTERVNRTLETMLRHYVNERNDNWSTHLTVAEIAINNCQQSSTKFSPFYLNYGFNPRFPFLIQSTNKSKELSTVPAAEEIFKTIQQNTQQAISNLKHAQQQQSNYANQHRRDDQFRVGEQVYVSTANMNITSGVNKLNPKFIGPFPISKVINPVAVKLKLPPHFKIHDSFHVSKIKRAKSTEQFPDRPVLENPPPVIKADNDQESEWEIDKIVNKRRRRNRVEYLVKWKGYDSHDNQWLPVSQLNSARDAIEDFEKTLLTTRLNSVSTIKSTTTPRGSAIYRPRSSNSTTSQSHQLTKQQTPINLFAATSHEGRIGSSVQCSAKTRTGQRCRRRTLRSGFCHFHLQRDQNLHIKQSSIPNAGLGLFAGNKPIVRNQVVIPYTGQHSSTKTNGKFVLEVNKNRFINANRYTDTGGFANECRRKDYKNHHCSGNNSKFSISPNTQEVVIKATKTIEPQTEVLIPYGALYWRRFDKTKLTQPPQAKLKQH